MVLKYTAESGVEIIMLTKYLSFCHSKQTRSSKKHYPTVIEQLCHPFSLEELRNSTNNFDENLVIGESFFSVVYTGHLKHNNGVTDHHKVALKRLKSKSDEWKFKKEVEFLCQLHHPNLVSLVGFCNHNDEKILVFENMSNGSLYDHIRFRDMEALSWKKRLEICIGAAHGLHYLHTGAKRTIFHCDIKPHNILLDDNMVPKLSHLGFSLRGQSFKTKPKPIKVDIIIGTRDYLAPEYVQTSACTDKCDVYSFGMVLLEVVSTNYQHTIFDKIIMLGNTCFWDISNFLDRVSADDILDPILMRKIAPACLAVFMDVIKGCLKLEPNERPAIGEVEVELEHALALQEEADAQQNSGDY